MKYRIYFKHKDGTRDSMIISGESIEKMKITLNVELAKRNAEGLFSEKIED